MLLRLSSCDGGNRGIDGCEEPWEFEVRPGLVIHDGRPAPLLANVVEIPIRTRRVVLAALPQRARSSARRFKAGKTVPRNAINPFSRRIESLPSSIRQSLKARETWVEAVPHQRVFHINHAFRCDPVRVVQRTGLNHHHLAGQCSGGV
jgi:hypothetical protein